MNEWKLFMDGAYCKHDSSQKELSRNVTSDGECMALSGGRFKYVSSMKNPANLDGNRYCFGFNSCNIRGRLPHYRTYVRRIETGWYQI